MDHLQNNIIYPQTHSIYSFSYYHVSSIYEALTMCGGLSVFCGCILCLDMGSAENAGQEGGLHIAHTPEDSSIEPLMMYDNI